MMVVEESYVECQNEECHEGFFLCKYCNMLLPEDANSNICGHESCIMKKAEYMFNV